MSIFFIAALMAVGMVVALLIVALVVIPALQRKNHGWRQSEQQIAEETRMIQTLHQQLARMDERVEALETILAAPGKKEGGA
jgi:phage shock protein B